MVILNYVNIFIEFEMCLGYKTTFYNLIFTGFEGGISKALHNTLVAKSKQLYTVSSLTSERFWIDVMKKLRYLMLGLGDMTSNQY